VARGEQCPSVVHFCRAVGGLQAIRRRSRDSFRGHALRRLRGPPDFGRWFDRSPLVADPRADVLPGRLLGCSHRGQSPRYTHYLPLRALCEPFTRAGRRTPFGWSELPRLIGSPRSQFRAAGHHAREPTALQQRMVAHFSGAPSSYFAPFSCERCETCTAHAGGG